MKILNTGDKISLMMCALILGACLLFTCSTATAGERRYERKCRKQAGRVDKAVQKCPSLSQIRVDTIEVAFPQYIHDTIIEIWGSDCEGCEFSHTITDTFYITKVVKDSSGLRVTNTRKARVDTVKVPCPTITSANPNLEKAFRSAQSSSLRYQTLYENCENRPKRKSKWWVWLLAGALVGGAVGQRWLRRLIGIPF